MTSRRKELSGFAPQHAWDAYTVDESSADGELGFGEAMYDTLDDGATDAPPPMPPRKSPARMHSKPRYYQTNPLELTGVTTSSSSSSSAGPTGTKGQTNQSAATTDSQNVYHGLGEWGWSQPAPSQPGTNSPKQGQQKQQQRLSPVIWKIAIIVLLLSAIGLLAAFLVQNNGQNGSSASATASSGSSTSVSSMPSAEGGTSSGSGSTSTDVETQVTLLRSEVLSQGAMIDSLLSTLQNFQETVALQQRTISTLQDTITTLTRSVADMQDLTQLVSANEEDIAALERVVFGGGSPATPSPSGNSSAPISPTCALLETCGFGNLLSSISYNDGSLLLSAPNGVYLSANITHVFQEGSTAWSPAEKTVTAGDWLRFEWDSDEAIQEVLANGVTPVGGGFLSGPRTLGGTAITRATRTGTRFFRLTSKGHVVRVNVIGNGVAQDGSGVDALRLAGNNFVGGASEITGVGYWQTNYTPDRCTRISGSIIASDGSCGCPSGHTRFSFSSGSSYSSYIVFCSRA